MARPDEAGGVPAKPEFELLEDAPNLTFAEAEEAAGLWRTDATRPQVRFMGYDEAQLREIVVAHNERQDQTVNFYGETLAAVPDAEENQPVVNSYERYRLRDLHANLNRSTGMLQGAQGKARIGIIVSVLLGMLDRQVAEVERELGQ